MTQLSKLTMTVRGIIFCSTVSVFATAGVAITPERHATIISEMSVSQLLAYALVISVIGNVVLVILFARLIMTALSANTKAFEHFSASLRSRRCPIHNPNQEEYS
jgi:hypothetical protein